MKFAIGDFDDKNQFQMKARKVIIYYYDQQDFELKVINLITLFEDDITAYKAESADCGRRQEQIKAQN